MATNVRRMTCTPDAVFRVLENGWYYPAWVVGASRMRMVEGRWPDPGARLHHSVGVWPFLIDDTTSVREWDPPVRAVMRARGWPIGEADVIFRVRPTSDGCIVRIDEEAVKGPGALVPRFIADPVLYWRNAETLKRLAFLAESRTT